MSETFSNILAVFAILGWLYCVFGFIMLDDPVKYLSWKIAVAICAICATVLMVFGNREQQLKQAVQQKVEKCASY